MQTETLKLRLRGSAHDDEHVRLNAFIVQLSALLTALNRTECMVSGGEGTTLHYRVTDLSHHSPATVTVDAVGPEHSNELPSKVINTLFGGLKMLMDHGEAPPEFDRSTLEAYRGLAAPLQRQISSLTIIVGGAECEISPRLSRSIDKVLGPDVLAKGSLKGELESINIHNTQSFAIYPLLGPKKVTCQFSEELFRNVQSALGQHVIAHGTLKYKARDPFPYAMEVSDLEIPPPTSELPSFWDLYGAAPDATGNMDSVSFVRRLRDAET
jgi:hypothetical protein